MRTFLYFEYLFNLVSENPNAKKIYKSSLADLKVHELPEEESATRKIREELWLERLDDKIRIIYKALHDATQLEQERAQVASTELTERNKILAEAGLVFEKIKKQYQEAQAHPAIAAEIQKHKQKAAELIAREWKKRHNVTKEGFVRVESQEFELV